MFLFILNVSLFDCHNYILETNRFTPYFFHSFLIYFDVLLLSVLDGCLLCICAPCLSVHKPCNSFITEVP